MNKTHCDICDSTAGATDIANETVRVDGPNNMLHDIRVEVDFVKKYPDNENDRRRDLCNKCKRNVFVALVAKFGGFTLVEAKARVEMEKLIEPVSGIDYGTPRELR